MIDAVKRSLAAALCCVCAGPLSFAQELAPVRSTAPALLRPYKPVFVPPIRLDTDKSRLLSLIRAGKLYLTVQDALAIAIESNLDVEIARYTSVLDQWSLERAQAGGALPGVPSASSQATSVTRGEGVRGSQAAAGVSSGTGSGTGSNTANATVTQIGPVTPTLDPVFQDATTFSHLSAPQPNLRQSGVENLIDNQRNYSASIQQGFLSGTQASITYTESYLNENAPTDVLNPQYAPTLSGTITQQFLQGFGVALNARFINIDKLNLQTDQLNFKSQVISVVVNVLNLYYGLVADYQDVRAKQAAVDVSQQFYENNRKQVELGALAPLDVTSAESQVAASQQALIDSRAALDEQQVALKNALSRRGTADTLLASVEIIPLDHLDVPEKDELPPLKDLVAKARANRADIAAEQMHLQVDQLSNLGTANNVRPVLAAQASSTNQGLAGAPRLVPQGPIPTAGPPGGQNIPGFVPCPAPNTGQICEAPDASFLGGINNALGQVFRRNYPTESAATYFFAHFRNRQAQADYTIDQLSERQDQLQAAKDVNQIAVDVSNQVVALQQARVRYLAAVKNRELEQQLFEAEQKKFALGASTTYNVVTQQRDFTASQSTEVGALQVYSNALIALGQTVGTTLDDTHISLVEARSGVVARHSALPSELPVTQ